MLSNEAICVEKIVSHFVTLAFSLSKILPLTVHFQAFTAYFSNAAESMSHFSSAQICKFREHAFVTLYNVPLTYC